MTHETIFVIAFLYFSIGLQIAANRVVDKEIPLHSAVTWPFMILIWIGNNIRKKNIKTYFRNKL